MIKNRFLRWWRSGWKVSDYHWIELLVARIALAGVVWISMVAAKNFTLHVEQPHPQGLAHLIDLTWMADPQTYLWIKRVLGIALLVYIGGYGARISLVVVALIHILVHTLHNSQGSTHHHAQIVSLVLLAQCLTHWWPLIWKAASRGKTWIWGQGRTVSQWAFHLSLQAIAATYVLAALSKLIKSKGLWIFQSHYISVEMMKTHMQNYYGKLVEATDADDLAMMQFLIDHPNVARLLLGTGLLLELFAFLLLLNRTTALIGGLLLISLHLGIAYLMKLHFPHNEQLLAIFAVNAPFWLFVLWWRRSRSGNFSLA